VPRESNHIHTVGGDVHVRVTCRLRCINEDEGSGVVRQLGQSRNRQGRAEHVGHRIHNQKPRAFQCLARFREVDGAVCRTVQHAHGDAALARELMRRPQHSVVIVCGYDHDIVRPERAPERGVQGVRGVEHERDAARIAGNVQQTSECHAAPESNARCINSKSVSSPPRRCTAPVHISDHRLRDFRRPLRGRCSEVHVNTVAHANSRSIVMNL
jgi:hypothetical protein